MIAGGARNLVQARDHVPQLSGSLIPVPESRSMSNQDSQKLAGGGPPPASFAVCHDSTL